jgi:putative spermidine/putrescine transport system ATP-binding protein
MSDRVAVFNAGQVAQLGTPAEIYERPATAFVAGFVGTSNLLTGATALRVLGAAGSFAVRPEKIHIVAADEPDAGAGPDEVTTVGRVAEVIYAGPATRYVVDLGDGVQLVALQQNLQTSSMHVMQLRDREVRLRWRREHAIAIPG